MYRRKWYYNVTLQHYQTTIVIKYNRCYDNDILFYKLKATRNPAAVQSLPYDGIHLLIMGLRLTSEKKKKSPGVVLITTTTVHGVPYVVTQALWSSGVISLAHHHHHHVDTKRCGHRAANWCLPLLV